MAMKFVIWLEGMVALMINYCYLNLEHLVSFVISNIVRNLIIDLKLKDSSSHALSE